MMGAYGRSSSNSAGVYSLETSASFVGALATQWEAYESERQVQIDERVAHAHLERATWMAEDVGGVFVDHCVSSEGVRGMNVDYKCNIITILSLPTIQYLALGTLFKAY